MTTKAPRVILHGFPTSSTSLMTRFMLNLRQIAFDEVSLPVIKREDGRPDAEGQKPFLEVNGKRVESPGAIFNFVNEMKVPGPPLLPPDPHARSQCRRLATVGATEIAPYGFYRVDRYLRDELGITKEGLDKWHKHWLKRGFKDAEHILNSADPNHQPAWPGNFLVGNQPTMADIFLQPMVHWSQWNPDPARRVDLSAFPKLQRTYMNAMELDAFKSALPLHYESST